VQKSVKKMVLNGHSTGIYPITFFFFSEETFCKQWHYAVKKMIINCSISYFKWQTEKADKNIESWNTFITGYITI